MKRFRRIVLASSALALGGTGAAHALDVVASIKPVHSLVAGVMEGAGQPGLLVHGAGSPHAYSLRPSEAAMLERAEVVFWVGPDMEMFLSGALGTLAGDATVVKLSEADGLTRLDYREGGPFEARTHDNDEEGHGRDDHAHDHHDAFDMHMWLDPENAKVFVGEIESALVAADPENAETYAGNAEALRGRLDELVAEVETALADVSGRGFVVFHDAYQYYENRFGVTATGSITVSPESMPGAARIDEIRTRVRDLDVMCVFAEPQFEPRLIQVVTEGTQARPGVLDPLGADLDDGPELYFDLIRNLTTSLAECLRGEG